MLKSIRQPPSCPNCFTRLPKNLFFLNSPHFPLHRHNPWPCVPLNPTIFIFLLLQIFFPTQKKRFQLRIRLGTGFSSCGFGFFFRGVDVDLLFRARLCPADASLSAAVSPSFFSAVPSACKRRDDCNKKRRRRRRRRGQMREDGSRRNLCLRAYLTDKSAARWLRSFVLLVLLGLSPPSPPTPPSWQPSESR